MNTNKDTIKIEDLADSMYVSLSTIKNDLKEVKKILGLPYNRSIGPVVKSEEDVIMEVYNKYAKEIEDIKTSILTMYYIQAEKRPVQVIFADAGQDVIVSDAQVDISLSNLYFLT